MVPSDAKTALRKVKHEYFLGDQAVARSFAEIDEALLGYDNPGLTQYYRDRVERFLQRHMLPYRTDRKPWKLMSLLHGEVEGLYRVLRAKAEADERLRESLSAFESAWERHSADWSQIGAKDVIRTASLFAESALVSASNGSASDFTRALSKMRTGNRFPSLGGLYGCLHDLAANDE